jgi:hypothetical protein
VNSDTVISKTDAMNDTSLSSLYRRMTAGAAGREVDANELVAAIDASDLPAERREAVAAVVAGSSAHASLARMLRELQPESEALAEAVRGKRHASHPLRGREARIAAGARRHHGHGHGLRWVGAVAACFVFAFALTFRYGESPTHWNDVAASASSAALPDRIFTTRDRIFAASDDASRADHSDGTRGDQLFHAGFAIGG